jgi:hypothetical protein
MRILARAAPKALAETIQGTAHLLDLELAEPCCELLDIEVGLRRHP